MSTPVPKPTAVAVSIFAGIGLLTAPVAATIWGTPIKITELSDPLSEQIDPCLWADGLTLTYTERQPFVGVYYAVRPDPASPFGTPTVLLEGFYQNPFVSDNGLELFVTGPDSNPNIMVSSRPDLSSSFGSPAYVAELNTSSREQMGSISPNGLTIYFQSDRPGGLGGPDIYMAQRPSLTDPFGTPVNLNTINSPFGDLRPSISADGLTLYFASDRADGVQNHVDIWRAIRADVLSPFGTPTLVTEVSTPEFYETTPCVSRAGDELYFARGDISPQPHFDLYVSPKSACGNGNLDPDEECDDGNLVDGDGCDSNCTVTACGNGVVTADEQCDDSNLSDGDGCSSTCLFEQLVPGNGSPFTDCTVEWAIINPNNQPYLNKRGMPNFKQTCTDGDATCDADGSANGECHFQLAVCVNNADPNLPDCTPSSGLEIYELKRPRPTSPRPQDAANATVLLDSFQELCSTPSCTITTSGRHNNVLTFNPPITAAAPNNCTEPVDIEVPLRGRDQNKKGKAVLKAKATAEAVPPKKRGIRDMDTLKLTCLPNPTTTTTTTTTSTTTTTTSL